MIFVSTLILLLLLLDLCSKALCSVSTMKVISITNEVAGEIPIEITGTLNEYKNIMNLT